MNWLLVTVGLSLSPGAPTYTERINYRDFYTSDQCWKAAKDFNDNAPILKVASFAYCIDKRIMKVVKE